MKIRRSRVDEFAEQVKGKRNIYCFGAGKALDNFLAWYKEYRLEDDIKYVVDNSLSKQGTLKECNGRDVMIISLKQMLQMISISDLILITTAKFKEVLEQLERYSELKQIDCYIYFLLKADQSDYDRERIELPEVFWSQSEIHIPKIIHYCWFGRNEIPEQNQIWMESWKKYCPDYQIIRWDEDNYDVSKNLYIKQAYEKKKWAFVSDYARLDIIAQYGGVYLDTDVELIQNIDSLLRNDAFCGFENKRSVNFGLGFGGVKHHWIIERLRDDYDGRQFVLEDGTLNQTTCPVYQTDFLVQYGLRRNGEFQKLDGITVYPERVLCALNPFSRRLTGKLRDAYSIHHFSASWVDFDLQKQKLKKEMMNFYYR